MRTLDGLFATGPRDVWVERLREADIVSAPINTLLEASNDPDVLANGYVTEIDYPKHGKRLKVHGSPWHFSETPAKIGIAPELGADNDKVLAGLGYTPAQIADLRERKIICQIFVASSVYFRVTACAKRRTSEARRADPGCSTFLRLRPRSP